MQLLEVMSSVFAAIFFVIGIWMIFRAAKADAREKLRYFRAAAGSILVAVANMVMLRNPTAAFLLFFAGAMIVLGARRPGR